MRRRMIVGSVGLAAAFAFFIAAAAATALAQGQRVSDVVNEYRITDSQIDAIAAAVKAKATHDEQKEFEEAGGAATPLFRNDFVAAQPIVLKLALGGSAGGAYYLGQLYDRGFDVTKGAQYFGHVDADYAKAVRLYRIAADAGSATAMRRMGDMYEMGRGVPKDAALAKEWHDKFEKIFFANGKRVECRPMPQCQAAVPPK